MRFLAGLLLALIGATAVAKPVFYLTDLEGSRVKLERFYRESGAFFVGDDGQWDIKPGVVFVYGGDVVDRYDGSMWVASELARLKRKRSHQVVLIVGNRDINKIRISAELNPEALKHRGRAFWFTDREKWEASANQSRVDRLKYILRETMGAPKGFQLRTEELVSANRPVWTDALCEKLSKRFGRPVSYDDPELVVESYLHELSFGNSFHTLLARSVLVWREENTLFVHGGLRPESIGWIPGTPTTQRIWNLDTWIRKINDWYDFEFWKWSAHPTAWSIQQQNISEALVQYSIPLLHQRFRADSLITGRNCDPLNNPYLPDASVMEWLLAHGINRLVYGHTPTGDFPVSLLSPDGRFEAIVADNSYTEKADNVSFVRFDGNETYRRGEYESAPQVFTPFEVSHVLGSPQFTGSRRQDGSIILGAVPNSADYLTFRFGERYLKLYQTCPHNLLRAQ